MRRSLPLALRSASARGFAERNADLTTGCAALLTHIDAPPLSIFGIVHKRAPGLAKRLSGRDVMLAPPAVD